MNTVNIFAFRGTVWTVCTYFVTVGLRLGMNICLSRMLAPDLLGVVIIVHAIRIGLELFSDLGIEQNVVRHSDGDQADFLNTAWTMQLVRGLILALLFVIFAPFLSIIYNIQTSIFFMIALFPLISSFSSTSIYILVKNMKIRSKLMFDLVCEFLSTAIMLSVVYIKPDIYSVILCIVVSLSIRTALSYMLPHPGHKIIFVRRYFFAIIDLAKWIMLSSILMYVSGQIDKLYLGGVMPLAVFGVYGLARTISDLPSQLAGRLAYQVFFPLISANRESGYTSAREIIGSQRWKILLLACFGVSFICSWSDIAVNLIYDNRYYDAGWMLFLLLIGSWFAILSSLNEVVLLSECPIYQSIAHGVRFITVAFGLVIGTWVFGIAGAVVGVCVSEIMRYFTLAVGQNKIDLLFAKQDILLTIFFAFCVVCWSMLRWEFGFGLAWDGLSLFINRR